LGSSNIVFTLVQLFSLVSLGLTCSCKASGLVFPYKRASLFYGKLWELHDSKVL